jgi:TonB family protein
VFLTNESFWQKTLRQTVVYSCQAAILLPFSFAYVWEVREGRSKLAPAIFLIGLLIAAGLQPNIRQLVSRRTDIFGLSFWRSTSQDFEPEQIESTLARINGGPKLKLLPEPKGRFGSFGLSLAANVVVGALLLLFAAANVHEAKTQKYNSTALVFPPPKPYMPPAPKVKVIAPPTKVAPSKIEPPKPKIAPPKVAEIRIPTPEAPTIAPAPLMAVAPPPQPKVGLFKSNNPTVVANNIVAPTPKTGGFGDPVGVTPNPNATKQPTIAAVGSFAGTPGVAQGAGVARQGSVKGVIFGSGVANGVPGGKDTRGTVASAGFSNGAVGGTGKPGGSGTIAQSGFGGTGFGAATPKIAAQEGEETTPLVVISKPRANYTPEARQLRIEGDVTLQVRFTANGQVEVMRVLNGLGHGLDEQARLVAQGIRFKPATKNGKPVDQVTVIHITFQLA